MKSCQFHSQEVEPLLDLLSTMVEPLLDLICTMMKQVSLARGKHCLVHFSLNQAIHCGFFLCGLQCQCPLFLCNQTSSAVKTSIHLYNAENPMHQNNFYRV